MVTLGKLRAHSRLMPNRQCAFREKTDLETCIGLLATGVIKFRTLPSENCVLQSHERNSRWMQFALTRQLAIVAGPHRL
jgi:hypothetical protein